MTNTEITARPTIAATRPRLAPWLRLDAVLIVVTIIWGSTFLIVQQTLWLVGPFTFLTLRFGCATLVLMLICHQRLLRLTRSELSAGLVIGLFLFATYALQTTGLLYTTSSKSAFITALYVPLVPLCSTLLLRQHPTIGAIIGVMLSFTGLGLLSINEDFDLTFGLGEWLTLGCAVASALHIVTISKFAPRADAINLTTVQIGLTALLSLIAIPIAGEPLTPPPPPVWWSAFFMGSIGTAFCLAIMNKVQQFMSSTRATLFYALEPVWAGIFGYLVGERLGVPALLGCGLIVVGIVASELRLSTIVNRKS